MKLKNHLRSLKYEENVTYCKVFWNYMDKSQDLIKDILSTKSNNPYMYKDYNSFSNALNKNRKAVPYDNIIYLHIVVIENEIKKGFFVYTVTKSEVKYKAFYDLEKIRVFQ